MHGSFFLQHVISHRALMTAATTILVALAPLGGASAYTLKTLHSFCKWDNCADGYLPLSRLIMDPSGNLYGTATNGAHSGGVLFKLVPNGDGSWKEYVLHAFCAAPNCADGDDPEGDLIMDVDGNLYGTTAFGGKYGYGAIFRLTHNGGGWTLKILHSFCASHNCSDGYAPLTGLSYVGQAPDVPWTKLHRSLGQPKAAASMAMGSRTSSPQSVRIGNIRSSSGSLPITRPRALLWWIRPELFSA